MIEVHRLLMQHPELGLLHASLNGARVSWKTAKKQKQEGMKAGVPDLELPVPRYPFHGLYIEMKRLTGGTVASEQRQWIDLLRLQGYRCEICCGYKEALAVLTEYINTEKWNYESIKQLS